MMALAKEWRAKNVLDFCRGLAENLFDSLSFAMHERVSYQAVKRYRTLAKSVSNADLPPRRRSPSFLCVKQSSMFLGQFRTAHPKAKPRPASMVNSTVT